MIFFAGIVIFSLVLYLGNRLGGIGIAYAAGLGLFCITLFLGIPPGSIPVNVIFIIIPVIASIAALELAGGLDYMVYISERILRSQPKYINILAPVLTFFLTVLVGTGHAAYSLMPVIVEVATRNNIKPVNPLSTAAIASQLAITSSPIAAAVVAFCAFVNPLGITLTTVLCITLPASLIAVILVGCLQCLRKQHLYDNFTSEALIHQKAAEISVADNIGNNASSKYTSKTYNIKKGAKLSVLLFLGGIALIVLLAANPSLKPTYNNGSTINNASLIMIIMLSIAYIIITCTKSDITQIVNQKTFKAGMSAAICIIGLAWLGDTLISHYKSDLNELAHDVLQQSPWLFCIITFVVAMFLYSQATTVTTLMPLAIALSLSPLTMVASFIAVNALFIIPTYPTVVAATQIDYTGTTKIGKYVLNHSFLIPGVLMLVIAIILAYGIGYIIL